jgi:hypothetical protein
MPKKTKRSKSAIENAKDLLGGHKVRLKRGGSARNAASYKKAQDEVAKRRIKAGKRPSTLAERKAADKHINAFKKLSSSRRKKSMAKTLTKVSRRKKK